METRFPSEPYADPFGASATVQHIAFDLRSGRMRHDAPPFRHLSVFSKPGFTPSRPTFLRASSIEETAQILAGGQGFEPWRQLLAHHLSKVRPLTARGTLPLFTPDRAGGFRRLRPIGRNSSPHRSRRQPFAAGRAVSYEATRHILDRALVLRQVRAGPKIPAG